MEGPFISINCCSMNHFQELPLRVTWFELPTCLSLRTGGLDRRTEQSNLSLLKSLQTFKTSAAFNLSEYISKHHQIAQTLLGKPAALSKVQQLNEQISECSSFSFFFFPSSFQGFIKWAFICMHEGWKENILKENTNPISLRRYGSAIFQTSIRFSYFRTCARASLLGGVGGEVGGGIADVRLYRPFCSPDTVFNSQLRTGVKLITSRHTQFKADFGGKM